MSNFKEENGDVPEYKLTDGELERLAILAEECGEVVQVIGKIIRHGYNSYNPFDEGQRTNRSLLERELGDILVAVGMLVDGEDINYDKIEEHSIDKKERIKKYLHFN